MSFKRLVVVLAFSGFLVASGDAQDTGSAKIYREQFVQLHERTKSFLDHAERQVKEGSSSADRSELRHEGLALTALVHRLSEEAVRAYRGQQARAKSQQGFALH